MQQAFELEAASVDMHRRLARPSRAHSLPEIGLHQLSFVVEKETGGSESGDDFSCILGELPGLEHQALAGPLRADEHGEVRELDFHALDLGQPGDFKGGGRHPPPIARSDAQWPLGKKRLLSPAP